MSDGLPLGAMPDKYLRELVAAAAADPHVSNLELDEAVAAKRILSTRDKHPTAPGAYWYFDDGTSAAHATPFGYGRWFIVMIASDKQVYIPGISIPVPPDEFRKNLGGWWGPRAELPGDLALANVALPEDRPEGR